MNSKPVSVIIPTYNRCDILFNTIVEFEKQSDLNFELLVIDQSEKLHKKITSYTSSSEIRMESASTSPISS